MKRLIVALGACAALSALPMGTFAHGYEAGDAALGGLIGGVVGGLIGTAIAPAPVVVEPYASAPVVVDRYDAPVVIERYAPAPLPAGLWRLAWPQKGQTPLAPSSLA